MDGQYEKIRMSDDGFYSIKDIDLDAVYEYELIEAGGKLKWVLTNKVTTD